MKKLKITAVDRTDDSLEGCLDCLLQALTQNSKLVFLDGGEWCPGGSDSRVCLQCRRPGFDSWVGKIPWRWKWQPTPVLLPGRFHGCRSLAGYSTWGHKELDTTEQHHFALLYTLVSFLMFIQMPNQKKKKIKSAIVQKFIYSLANNLDSHCLSSFESCVWILMLFHLFHPPTYLLTPRILKAKLIGRRKEELIGSDDINTSPRERQFLTDVPQELFFFLTPTFVL